MFFFRYLVFLSVLFHTNIVLAENIDSNLLRGGWYLLDPFQYQDHSSGQPILTGLDVELTKAITQKAGFKLRYEQTAWRDQIRGLIKGGIDIASGATFTNKRKEYAHFSIPYRQETNVLYVRKGEVSNIQASNVDALIQVIRKNGFRLGVIDGYVYANDDINQFIDNPMIQYQIIRSDNDYSNFKKLLNHEIDGFLADHIVASTVAWRSNIRPYVEAHPLTMTKDIHLMLSRQSVSSRTVEAIDAAIIALREDGTFNQINKRYIFPILLSQTIDSLWFFIIDVMGTFAFALSGLLLAYTHRYDIFGAFVLAALPAVGGGVVRDLITDRSPIGIMANPIYLYIIILTVVLGYGVIMLFSYRSLQFHKRREIRLFTGTMIHICDTLGLAAFTVTGVVVALSTQSEPFWLWGAILATLTGAGGGILRDVLRSDPDIPALKGELYPEIAFIWGLILSLYLMWQTQHVEPGQLLYGIIGTVCGVFATRLIAIYFNIKSPRYYRQSAT